MKKIVFCLCGLWIWTTLSFAQSATDNDNLLLNTGFMLNFVPVDYRATGSTAQPFFTASPLLYSISLGGNYILYQKNDLMSVGFDPNLNFSFGYSNYSGSTLMAQVPVFMLVRAGANCTKYNEQVLGAGIGAGVNYFYINYPYTNYIGRVSKLKENVVAPAAMGEVTIHIRYSTYSIRFQSNLLPFETISKDPSAPGNFIFKNFAVGLLYTLKF